ncbi:MAG: glycosyltransferase family 9 protein [Candidatus Kerfeldbacteria bacterium]|nr:glycosyltransferase family 9 protein [Candidatus Kerfeldbacteria bacterium]
MKSVIVSLGKILFLFKKRILRGSPKKILIIRSAGIGDVLMSTPLIRNLKDTFPQAEIVYVVGAWSRGVLEGNPYISKIIDFPDEVIWKKRWFEIGRLIREIRRQRADLGFVLERHFLAGVFAFLCGIKFRIGLDRRGEGFANNRNVTYGPVRHEVEYYLDLLRSVIDRPYNNQLEVFPSDEDRGVARSLLKRFKIDTDRRIGIMVGGAENPGQAAYLKRWPLDHYRSLIRKLITASRDVVIVLFGARSDRPLNEQLITKGNDRVFNAAGDLTVLQSVTLMATCNLFITHDSGPMHMAAASGVPVISIFGPTHPKRYAPLGPHHRYLWKPDRPGALTYDEGKFPQDLKEVECMRAVTPDEVMAEVKSYWAVADGMTTTSGFS